MEKNAGVDHGELEKPREMLQLANEVLDTIQSIINDDPQHVSMNLDTLINDSPICEHPDLDRITRTSGKYHIAKVFEHLKKRAHGKNKQVDIVSADFSTLTTGDEDNDSRNVRYLSLTNVRTTDGITSRYASLIDSDGITRMDRVVAVFSNEGIVATSSFDTMDSFLPGTVMEYAEKDQMDLIEKVNNPHIDQEDLDYAMSLLEAFAASIADEIDASRFMDKLRERREQIVIMGDFGMVVSPNAMGKEDLELLIKELDEKKNQ